MTPDAALNEAGPAPQIAVVGAGPVGLALALQAARALPAARITLFDARPAGADASRDMRTLAISLGSIHLLKRLGAWDAARAWPITEVLVSQQPPSLPGAQVRLTAEAERVEMLGAVLAYGALVAPLEAAWHAEVAREPQRLSSRFGTPVAALKNAQDGGVEVDAGVAERYDLAVVAEGGVFADQARKAVAHDYGQTAWVGPVVVEGGVAGRAVERFTRHGPAALLPRGLRADGRLDASLVWCVPSGDDPVRALDAVQRLAVLNRVFPPDVGRLVEVGRLKDFALGLNAERSLVQGRRVRIGNAAQTLHPVAGQGLNLGLRDAQALVDALRAEAARPRGIDRALARVEWQRAPDRWGLIAATDFLARSFTWRLPGLGAARGAGLALLERLPPVKSALARQMMYGSR